MQEVHDADEVERTVVERQRFSFQIESSPFDARMMDRLDPVDGHNIPTVRGQVQSVPSITTGEIERAAWRKLAHRFDDEQRRILHDERRTTIVAVSLGGKLRYVWRAIVGGGPMLKMGDMAPDFELSDHKGRRRKLSDFRGK